MKKEHITVEDLWRLLYSQIVKGKGDYVVDLEGCDCLEGCVGLEVVGNKVILARYDSKNVIGVEE